MRSVSLYMDLWHGTIFVVYRVLIDASICGQDRGVERQISHMAKYVFLNMPASGHVNPTLAVAQELVRREQMVSYYLTEEFRDVVEATGAVFQPYESKLKGISAAGASFFTN